MLTTRGEERAEQPPLRRFNKMQRAELESLAATAGDWLTPCKLTTARSSANDLPLATMSATSLGYFKLVYAHTVGTEIDVDFTQQESNYVVSFALNGWNQVSVGDDRALCVEQCAVILSPRMVAGMKISDGYQQLHIGIQRAALERHLEGMIGRAVTKPILFRMNMDLTRPALASWARGVRLLVDDLDAPDGLSGTDLRADPWSDFLMTGLLLAQPHNYSESLLAEESGSFRPQPLRRAVNLIESEPASDLSLSRLCSAARVGPRALQRYFHDHLGCSPREYVQSVRLEKAHKDLLGGSGPTVAEVAYRWGFTHVPRFAGAYRKRYGMSPSVTLRSAR